MSRHRSPRHACQWVDRADFGFGDPEYHPCTDAAEFRTKAFAEPPLPGRERLYLCAFHGRRIDVQRDLAAYPGVRAYRFRRLASR